MFLKSLLAIVVVLVIVAFLYLMHLGKVSKNGSAPGLADNKLAPCPASPNCVCSEYADDTSHYVKAMSFSGSAEQAIEKLTNIVTSLGGLQAIQTDNYLATTFTSKLFGFVDDVEFRIDETNQLVHIRSASRVGHGDMDANRNRAALIQAQFSDN